MLNLLLPAAALCIVLGIGGALLIHGVVETTHDRVLDGSVLAIVERLAVDEGEVTVDLPQVALGMLESQAHDSIYYSVIYDGTLVTGYQDLPLIDVQRLEPGRTEHWDAAYRGFQVRVAAQARRVYGKPDPVLVAVAETTGARRMLEHRMLGGLILMEAGLIGVVGLLAWHAVGRGLRPLADLSRGIDRQAVRGAVNLRPLDLSAVPREALAPAAALNALLERLDQSIGAIQRFTADASHQLRTPLAIVHTHLDLVRRHGSDTPAGRSALDDIEAATLRLERLLTQLLALARADDETVAEPAQILDLRRIAAEIVAERVPQALAAGIEVQFDGAGDVVAIRGDPLLVGELIANLLDNAIRYNHRGGTVTVRVTAERGCRRLEVEDDGPGIPAVDRMRVFERFYRVARKDGPEGSGLGLSIVRALADRLGARIALCDSEQGRGLLVVVDFLGPVER
jgi:two-component system sensor histidine kinase TctE